MPVPPPFFTEANMKSANCARYVLALVMVFFCLSPAQAARFEYFSARVPAGWRAFEEGAGVSFLPGGRETAVIVVAYRVEQAEPVAIAREFAAAMDGQDRLRQLAGPNFILTTGAGRTWLSVTDDMVFRVFVSIETGPIPKEVPSLLNSLAPLPDRPVLAKAIAALHSSPETVQWLAGTGPGPKSTPVAPLPVAGLPDFASFGNRRGDTAPPPAMKELPAGWSASRVGHWAIATSADRSLVIAKRTYAIAGAEMNMEDGWPLEATARDLAALFGGRNITSGEGSMYFVVPEGQFIVEPKRGSTTEVFFYNTDDALYTWMGLR